jgi:alpha-L-fucosidase
MNQNPATPGSANASAVERFIADRFGMFIHWGIYAVIGRGEWVMHRESIPVAEYEPLADRFTADRFDAGEWVDLAVAAGQRYIVITSKHHDGFCMFDTAETDYRVTARTPFGRDPLAELADACRVRGVGFGFYHSLLDWHHPAYTADWSVYRDYLFAQVRELCSGYGPVYSMWFDGHWPASDHAADKGWVRPDADYRFDELYGLIHELQPDCMVGNNHHVDPLPGEDFQIFEQDLPGENTAGHSAAGISALPLETCLTMNRSWGWNATDEEYKSADELITTLGRLAELPANLLLNVGPRPDGTIPERSADLLRELGRRRG